VAVAAPVANPVQPAPNRRNIRLNSAFALAHHNSPGTALPARVGF